MPESSFPLTVKTTATDNSGIDFVDILYTKEGTSGTSRVARVTTPAVSPANRYDAVWNTSPGPGTYTVYAVAYDKTGNTTESERHTITIK